jgi:DNA polymerase-1
MSQNDKPTLFLVDVNSHMYRAYHAALAKKENDKDSSYHNGKPNYIIRGVINLIEDEIRKTNIEPDYISLILDHDGKNFRHELYPDYKGNRDPTPKELVFMRKCIFKILKLKGYNTIQIEGVEADDVIGTMAKKASTAGMSVYILSKDKDFFQLINDNIYLFNGGENKLYTYDEVLDSKGVPPEKILDYLTFLGDVADNIMGVPNVGGKSSVLILKNHNLEQIVENPELLDSIKGLRSKNKIIDYIKENKEFILLMKTLVSLKDNLDLGISLKDMIKKQEDHYAVQNAFQSLGLRYNIKPEQNTYCPNPTPKN